MKKEIPLEIDDFTTIVEVHYYYTDASFDHEFGTRYESEQVLDEFTVKDFQQWDETGDYIISVYPSKEQLKKIEQVLVDAMPF